MTARMPRSLRRKGLLLLASAVAPLPTLGETNTWIANSGSWSKPGNWSRLRIPIGGDDVEARTWYSGDWTINYDYAGADLTLETLTIVHLGETGSVVLLQEGHRLASNLESISSDRPARHTQTGGTNLTTWLRIGYWVGKQGAYEISGGLLWVNTMDVGYGGLGTFTQSNGTVSAGFQVEIGSLAGSSGIYSMSGGTLSTPDFHVANRADGTFDQSGGAVSITGGGMGVGVWGGTGTYNMSGSASLSTTGLYLGIGTSAAGVVNLSGGTITSGNTVLGPGAATFNHSGGTHTISGLLTIQPGTDKTYTLSGSGRLVGNVSNSGTFNFSGGVLEGTFSNSGTVTGTVDLTVARPFTNSGRVTFGGLKSLSISANGTGGAMVQTGGSVEAYRLTVGYSSGESGNVSQSGGELNVNYLEVGRSGSGTFVQSGGTNAVTQQLTLGWGTTGSGQYTLSGGNLISASTVLDRGSAAFVHSGGTHSVSGLLDIRAGDHSYTLSGSGRLVGNVSNGGTFNFDGGTFDGTFNNSGSVVSSVSLTRNKGFTNSGSVNMGANDLTMSSAGTGAVLVQTGGALMADLVSVGSAGQTGRVSLSGGAFTVNQARVGNAGAGLFLQSGGTVNASTLVALGYAATGNGAWEMTGSASVVTSDVMVGRYGIGELNQFDGVLSASSEIFVGYYSTGSGQYNLIGGSASADYLYVGRAGSGTASQSGGSLTLTSGLRIGYTSLGVGTYSMSNGASLMTGHERVGVEGRGTFNQTGGSHSVSGTLTVGYQAAGSGVVNLSGGTLSTGNTVLGPGSASFNHSGGTHTISGLLTIQSGTNKSYTLSGSGRLVGNVSNAGTFNFDGGALEGTLNNSGTVAVHGIATMRYGFSNVGNVTLQDALLIGSTAPGASFVQTAGSLKGEYFIIGDGVGQTGVASWAGGEVDILWAVVGSRGSGTLTQSGGTTRLDFKLNVGEAASGAGVFNLNNGSVSAWQTELGPGSATINHSGGTLTVENVLILYPGANKAYNLSGSGRLVGYVSNAATFNFQGGRLEGQFINSGTMASPVSGDSTVSGNVTNTGSISVAGRLAIEGTISGSGSVSVTGEGNLSAKCVRQAVVSAGSASVIQMLSRSQGGETSVVNTLSLSGGAVMDLADNALVVEYSDGSPLGSVRAAIVSAYSPTSAAHWNGAGISSRVAAASSSRYGVGFGEASDLLFMEPGESAVWQGQTVDSSAVLARFTLLGDADLSGSVNFFDLTRLAAYYGGAGDWSWGDFNYDGQINFFDLTALAANYGGAVPAGAIPGAGAGFGSDLEAAFAQVPEPSVLGVLGGLLMLRRRRGRG